MKRKKGLTPIIAVILLLMMTVAAAGAAFFWFIRIQGELQGGSEVYSEQLAEKVSAKVGVLKAEYDYSSHNLSIYLQNIGNRPVPLSKASTAPTTFWILQDSEQNVICSDNWAGPESECVEGCASDLGIKETRKVVLQLNESEDCSIANDTTYPNGSLFYFTIDFSGITATGGRFTK